MSLDTNAKYFKVFKEYNQYAITSFTDKQFEEFKYNLHAEGRVHDNFRSAFIKMVDEGKMIFVESRTHAMKVFLGHWKKDKRKLAKSLLPPFLIKEEYKTIAKKLLEVDQLDTEQSTETGSKEA